MTDNEKEQPTTFFGNQWLRYLYPRTPASSLATGSPSALYLWVRASEVIWWEYTRIISILSDAK